ncbi:hypothetical protein F4808DRAFT_474619 [Astrocystis sublimbata]|nr:hypothetical protein F4808DRAFT_474614 [Astrocystis sublimbata]KAI0195527.1 hypothetical protein F4808DRAFT_474619 [Astrocystis sublimbata]
MSVKADYIPGTLARDYAITVDHTWLHDDGIRRVTTASGQLPSVPDRNSRPIDAAPLSVDEKLEKVPGLVGTFGTWSAVAASNLPNPDRPDLPFGVKFELSAPAGYTRDAPAFDVSCSYTYNPDATAYSECAPLDGSEDSKVTLWYTFVSKTANVRHEWAAAGGSKYRTEGTSPAVDLYEVNELLLQTQV